MTVRMEMLQHYLPCIYDHETCTRQVTASGLQDKDRRNPLFQTSLSRHEAAGNRKKIQCRIITRQLFATLQKRETEASKSGIKHI